MALDEKLWVLDKCETLALSGWLSEALTIRREMNLLVFDHWDKVKREKALSRSVLRRYVGYWNTHRALVDREAIGVHGGHYAEELIASVVRARIKYVKKDVEIHQNRWDKIAKRESDICAIRKDKTVLVIEVKSALTKQEWEKTRQIKEIYQKLSDPPAYWLVALRVDALDAALEGAVDNDPTCCVLTKQGRGRKGGDIFKLPEEKIEIWKTLEDWLDLLMDSF